LLTNVNHLLHKIELVHWTFTKPLLLPPLEKKIHFPSVSASDCLKQTAADMLLLHLLKNARFKATYPLHFGPPVRIAFAEVAIILGSAINMSTQSKT